MVQLTIPDTIHEQYGIRYYPPPKQLGGGIINTTFAAESNSGKIIVQKVHPVIDPVQTEDYQVVSQHLIERDWEIPTLVESDDANLYERDAESGVWRAFTYISSDKDAALPSEIDKEFTAQAGALLARLHGDLAGLDYKPQFQFPNFHDIDHHARELGETLGLIESSSTREMANQALELYHNLDEQPDSKTQLIHADPKMNNILTRNGIPFTFIDWDTAMVGPRMIDLGDMVRSVMGRDRHNPDSLRASFPLSQALIDGYGHEAHADLRPAEFRRAGLQAGARVTLDLSIRFLADCTPEEDGYFGFDPCQFATRQESNKHQALRGLIRYDQIQNVIQQ